MNTGTKVAIHQPNYLPWMGYFYKMSRADVFVFLDTVQFSKGSYQNRVKIKTPNGTAWLTQPVSTSGKGSLLTRDVEFSNDSWPEKHYKTLTASYARSSFWETYEKDLRALLSESSETLVPANVSLIEWMARQAGIDVDFRIASGLGVDDDDPSKRLARIVRAVGGRVSVHGSGALEYHDESVFEKNGIALEYSDFEHPVYPQLWDDEFVPGLSMVDAMFNVGPEITKYFR